MPFLNLFDSVKGIKEIWKASDPSSESLDEQEWRNLETPTGFGSWWFLVIGSQALHLVDNSYVWNCVNGVCTYYTADSLIIISPILTLLVNLATILIINKFDIRLDKKIKIRMSK